MTHGIRVMGKTSTNVLPFNMPIFLYNRDGAENSWLITKFEHEHGERYKAQAAIDNK